MQPNKNLQAVKLRAIARGLGASISIDAKTRDILMQWDEFLVARVYYGRWQQAGRIIIQAHHSDFWHNRPAITVSASRPVTAIVRDIQNRFTKPAREFCLGSEQQSRATKQKQLMEKLRVQSFLDELGADYDEAKKQGNRFHSRDFLARGVSFSAYEISENRGQCSVAIECSEHCLRHILRLVRSDFEFRQIKANQPL